MIRKIKHWYQRAKRGYSDEDVWNLDWYLRGILAGGLRQLADNKNSYPGAKPFGTFEKWLKFLRDTAQAFQDVIDYEDTGWEKDKDYSKMKQVYKKEEQAIKNLAPWFGHLWD